MLWALAKVSIGKLIKAGGGPIVSRNCSSLAVDFANDIWRKSSP